MGAGDGQSGAFATDSWQGIEAGVEERDALCGEPEAPAFSGSGSGVSFLKLIL